MDLFDESLLNLWRALNNHQVRYVMIGGVATSFHGYSSLTRVADLYIEDSGQNREHLGDALEELSIAPKEIMLRFQFIPGWATLEMDNGVLLDIMTTVKGLEHISFSECYNLAQIAGINDVNVPFLHLNHLLMSKRATNRPKDQLDILELERLDALSKEIDQASDQPD